MTTSTTSYYDRNADAYVARTIGISMEPEIETFLSYLPEGASELLDTGCGSGRDTKELLGRGFRVLAADGSEAMVRLASRRTGRPVVVLKHQDVAWEDRFDGIWASATLLHVPRPELGDVFDRYRRALRPGGVLFASFQVGEEDEDGPDAGGRHFTYMNELTLGRLIGTLSGFRLLEVTVTPSRSGQDRVWLAAYLRRVRC